ncbi:MAG: hypothetical protein PF549_04735 [Patescibacteria group bacterium]|jgi:hypothetical protein|nr:hypothetical protein [Patescibacteria group bacterium]
MYIAEKGRWYVRLIIKIMKERITKTGIEKIIHPVKAVRNPIIITKGRRGTIKTFAKIEKIEMWPKL